MFTSCAYQTTIAFEAQDRRHSSNHNRGFSILVAFPRTAFPLRDRLGRDTDYYRSIRYVSSDDGARSHDCTLAYPDSWHDDRVNTNEGTCLDYGLGNQFLTHARVQLGLVVGEDCRFRRDGCTVLD